MAEFRKGQKLKKRQFPVQLDKETHEKARQAAFRNRMTIKEFVTQAIDMQAKVLIFQNL